MSQRASGYTEWTDSEIERFRSLAKTCSTGQCAKVLSREFGRPLSRSAIAGKAKRLGVRIRDGQRSQTAPRRSAPKRPVKRKPVTLPFIPLPPPPALFHEATGCLYAVSTGPPYLFCNARVAVRGEIAESVRKTSPHYCAKHAASVASNKRLNP